MLSVGGIIINKRRDRFPPASGMRILVSSETLFGVDTANMHLIVTPTRLISFSLVGFNV